MNWKVYKSSKQESKTRKENLKSSNLNGNIAAVSEPPNLYFHQTSNFADQPNSFTNLTQKNTRLRYVLYWNEAYENKGKNEKNISFLLSIETQMFFCLLQNTKLEYQWPSG